MARENVSLVAKPYITLTVRIHTGDLTKFRDIAHDEDLPVATLVRRLILDKIASGAVRKKKPAKGKQTKARID